MALSSTERGRRFLARKREERLALIGAGLEPAKRSRKVQPAVPVLSGASPRAEGAHAMTGKTRRVTPPGPVDAPTRPGGPAAWPRAILYCFVADSGLPHVMTEAEVAAWVARRAALRRPWPADLDAVALDDLVDPGESWVAPVRVGPGARALARLRRGACAFPEGEPDAEGFAYCGDPVHSSGASYCAEHAARCYGKGKP